MKHLAARNQRLNYKWPKQNGLDFAVNTKSRGTVAPGSISTTWLDPQGSRSLHPPLLPFPKGLQPSPQPLPSCVMLAVIPDASCGESTLSKEEECFFLCVCLFLSWRKVFPAVLKGPLCSFHLSDLGYVLMPKPVHGKEEEIAIIGLN